MQRPLNATAILIELEMKGPGAGADGLAVNQNCSGIGDAMLFEDRHEALSPMPLIYFLRFALWCSYYPSMAGWPGSTRRVSQFNVAIRASWIVDSTECSS